MLIQGSPEWFAARLGKVTASRVVDVVARTKTGYSTSRANYAAELLCERLTKRPTESFCSSAMQWGKDTEHLARAAYAMTKGVDVYEVGFIDHPEIAMSGASPDGLVGDDGLLEIKAPNTATHLDTLEAGGPRPSTSRRCNGSWPAPAASGATSSASIRACRRTSRCSSSASPRRVA
jgi:predicted phage-related endonuclease